MKPFNLKDRVIYIPHHANGNRSHKDVEAGAISSIGQKYIFVKFDKQVKNLGWEGSTAQACDPSQIFLE